MPDPEPPTPELPDLDDAAYQRALAVLLDVGTALALELKSPAADQTAVQRAQAFPNVATAVRRTIILSRHLRNDPHAAADPAAKRTDARKHIIRKVEDFIGQAADPADAGTLRLELLERLDTPEFDAELAQRTPEHLIEEICRDLGIATCRYGLRYTRRTPDDLALLNARAAAPPGAHPGTWRAPASFSLPPPPSHPPS